MASNQVYKGAWKNPWVKIQFFQLWDLKLVTRWPRDQNVIVNIVVEAS